MCHLPSKAPYLPRLSILKSFMAPTSEHSGFPVDGSHDGCFHQDKARAHNDPVLKKSLEHQHAHLHHDANAKKGGEDEVVYSHTTTMENAHVSGRSAHMVEPEKSSLDQLSSEEDPQTHTLSSFYSKYRLLLHLFIWLLFTGSASLFLLLAQSSLVKSFPGWRM